MLISRDVSQPELNVILMSFVSWAFMWYQHCKLVINILIMEYYVWKRSLYEVLSTLFYRQERYWLDEKW